ncbi:MAG TPA: LCP family protein [Solirubrobacteraceae bacterium]|jgi:LCP family protein required for cell wall assembly
MAGPEPPPKYTKYRSRPSLLDRFRGRKGDGSTVAPRREAGAPPPGKGLLRGGRGGTWRRAKAPRAPGTRRPITWKRVVKWLALAIAGWILLSLLVFLVSAQIEQGKISDETESALDPGPFPLAGESNILVLGSDTRSEDTDEPGSSTSGNGRSDSILLLRIGGGANSRLSIARDTIVDIPGGGRQKINAAYAIGGAGLAVKTIKNYLGIEINHVIEVSFGEFPELIDAMGGIDYKGGCVRAKVNGGARNGGVTLRIPKNEEVHLTGKKALALARVRKNDCVTTETDLDRAARQQKIVGAMKGRVMGVHGFLRGPWIAWQAPKTLRSDMSGPTLMSVFANLSVRGTPESVVLGTISGEVPEDLKRRRVEKFLDG